jgi:4-cresol dehydrogenase (hydroxylating)
MSTHVVPTVLPDGLSTDDFDRLIGDLIDALGAASVITDDATLREYRDPYSYRESDEFDAAAVVTPTTTEQVQAIVRLANRYGVSLWTISQGRNNTYGGPAPRVRGSIIVSLRNMNTVVEINEELAYAVVEPGVRWFDLHDALEANGGGLWSSIPDLGWGSVVGNSLDYGIGYSPNGDHASQLHGMEVVLANGEVLRTGFGAMPGNENWHTYPHAFGPELEGLFKQSNLGIVTRVGVWLIPRPEMYNACYVRFSGLERLGPVVDALRRLMMDDVITNLPMFTHGLVVDEDGVGTIVPGSDVWSARFALYGTKAMTDARFDVISAAFDRVEGADVVRKEFLGTDTAGPSNHDERVQRGIPDMDLLDPAMLPYGEHTAHLDLSPIGTALGSDAVRLQTLMAELYAKRDRWFVGGILLNKRSALHISTTFYDPRDEAQTADVFAGYGEMVDELAAAGYVPYRTNLQNMDHLADQFSFGDHAQLRFAERLKDALDPNGVLAPGKSGIWPAALRPAR